MKVTDISAGMSAGSINIKEIAGKLDIGDVVKARILDISANELVLKLRDGSVLKAASMAPLEVVKGQLVDFIVKNKSDNQLFIETFKSNDAPSGSNVEEQLKTELKSLDINPTDKNMEIANAIKAYSSSINKDSFKNILDSLKFFNNLSPLKAAFLSANQIKIEEKNISALNNLLDSNNKLGRSLESLKGILDSLDDKELINNLESELEKLGIAKEGITKEGITKLGIAKEEITKESNNSQQKTMDYSNDKFIDGKNLVKAENAISLIKQGISKSDNSLVKSFLKDVLDNDPDSLIKMSQEFKDDGISSEDKLRDFINNKLLFSDDIKQDVNNTKFSNLKYNSIDNGAGDFKEEINLILKNIIDKLNNSQDNK
ncbi:MAG: hypothetical protein Q8942_08525, partial [Bacillota bacterium]|nr:hypothetical protein [Bacillota bacterium]